MHTITPRVKFLLAWAAFALLKLWLALRLDLFGDEAFYAWEGRQLAWAYSDLPAGTAWLAALGMRLGEGAVLALRAPFLLMGLATPWLVVEVARRWFGAEAGWRAGLWALLMPLGASLGLLALPDVPLTFATLLCLAGIAALLERRSPAGLAVLAVALVLGALSHYRFVVALAAGLLGLLLSREGRALLRWPPLWGALAIGAAAWLPLVHWNLAHRGAGVDFQLVERHPWAFHWEGALFPLVQTATLTPLLFALLVWALWQVWRHWRRDEPGPWGLLLGAAGLPVLGYFALGFFADSERVSFHWPLPGWLALCVALPFLMARTGRGQRLFAAAAAGVALLGTGLLFALALLAASPGGRERLADTPVYPTNFAGWRELAAAVDARLADLPADTRLVASHFMPAAALAFHLGRTEVDALDHPANHKHGRAAQIALWERQVRDLRQRTGPVLLVVDAYSVKPRQWLDWRRRLCAIAGPLPPPRTLVVDGGRKRYWLFELPPGEAASGPCVAPPIAWIDQPLPGARISGEVEVSGWAMQEGVGVRRIEVLLDDVVLGEARLGLHAPGVRGFWGELGDPNDPDLGYETRIDVSGLAPGRYRMALRVTGGDGSVEWLAPQWVEVVAP